MKAFAELLLVITEVWDSTSWQSRTSQITAPWNPPFGGPGRMKEEQATKLKLFVDALQDPVSILGRDETEERQDKIWMDTKFKDVRSYWISWLSSQIKHWSWIHDIDAWATSIGLGYDDLIRLSQSYTVSPTLLKSRFMYQPLRLNPTQFNEAVKTHLLNKKDIFLEEIFPDDAPGLRYKDGLWSPQASVFAQFVLEELTLARWQEAAEQLETKLQHELAATQAAYDGENMLSSPEHIANLGLSFDLGQ